VSAETRTCVCRLGLEVKFLAEKDELAGIDRIIETGNPDPLGKVSPAPVICRHFHYFSCVSQLAAVIFIGYAWFITVRTYPGSRGLKMWSREVTPLPPQRRPARRTPCGANPVRARRHDSALSTKRLLDRLPARP
jgi:hypothetical protein